MKKIIYDLGCGDGSNIPYYLMKADQVIAIDANPHLCKIIKNQFTKEIKTKKLILKNLIITDRKDRQNDIFYIHKYNNLLGQYPKPLDKKNFNAVSVDSINIISLLKSFGRPYYLKIDLEKYDNVILKKLLLNKIIPPYLSVEINNDLTIKILHNIGNYDAFKIVNGKKILKYYKKTLIRNYSNEKVKFSFSINSAGPFGDDIHGNWMSYENLNKAIFYGNIGWNDIHCSKSNIANPNYLKLPEMRLQNKIKFFLNRLMQNIF